MPPSGVASKQGAAFMRGVKRPGRSGPSRRGTSPGGRGSLAGCSSEETPVDRRKSVRAPGVDTRELLELMHTAIVVGTAIAAMWGLLDLFNVV